MWLRVYNPRKSIFGHPTEEVHVLINTLDGMEGMIVSRRSIRDGCVDIGWPVGVSGDAVLVDLGRETDNGYFRAWVLREEVSGWEQTIMGLDDLEEEQLELPLETPKKPSSVQNSGP